MSTAEGAYDPRYLGGILFFNARDFFEAHEVWESIWLESAGPERRFYQGLIQAAVGLLHFGNGNVRGALKLYRTGHAYMEGLNSPYLGLDIARFWQQMAACFAPLLADPPDPDRHLRPDEELMPVIVLEPPPAQWPDLEDFTNDKD